MYDIPSGDYVRAYVASDDLSTPAAITLLDRDGGTRTLAAGERLVLTDIVINNGGTARTVTIFQDANGNDTLDSGEALYAASLAANSQNSGNFSLPIQCQKFVSANDLMVVASGASAGTRIIITGVIVKT